MKYEFIEPPKDPAAAAEFLAKEFLPLFVEFWEDRGKVFHDADQPDFQPADFTHLWLSRTLVLLLAYDAPAAFGGPVSIGAAPPPERTPSIDTGTREAGSGRPCGFILAAQLRPLTHARRQLHVEAWFGRTPEIERGLFDCLAGILKFFPAEVMVVPDYGRPIRPFEAAPSRSYFYIPRPAAPAAPGLCR